MMASETNADLQPCVCTSQAASGRNTVLEKPAMSVTAVSARDRWRSNHTATTANAGSYRTAAITSPIATHTR
jgi:hypothetical protein